MFEVMTRFSFVLAFWVGSDAPIDQSVLTNGVLSAPFKIKRGTAD